MADLGEVKAKVTVEYDGSGLEEARKDLASLGDLGGAGGESIGGLGEELAGLNEKFAASAKGAQSLNAAIGALDEPLSKSGDALSGINETLDESQQAIEDTASAFEDLQKPIEGAAKQLQSIGETTDYTAANLSTFHDMLSDPAPFSMLSGYLEATGQSQQDFTSSIGDSNTQMLEQMARTSDVTHEVLGGMTSDAQGVSKAFSESANSTQVFTDQFNSLNDAATNANAALMFPQSEMAARAKLGYGVEGGLIGPAAPMESVGILEGLGNAFNTIGQGLSNIMMPMFAIQMGSMVVGQLATGIYDMASLAEGPAAHGVGTFTGTVDALGQTAQKASEQFSEGFGQAIIPTLQALNYQMSQGGMGGMGGVVGGIGAFLFNLSEITTGLNIQGGFEGLINQGAALLGFNPPFQGPGPQAQADVYKQQQMAQLPQQMQMDAAQTQVQASKTLAESVNTTNLAANDYAQAVQQFAQYQQQNYDISHPISRAQLQANASYDNYLQQQAEQGDPWAMQALGMPVGPIRTSAPESGFDWGGIFGGIGDFLHKAFTPGNAGAGGVGLGVSPGADMSMGLGAQIAQQISGIQLPHIDLSNMTANLSGAFSGMSLPHIDLGGIMSGLSGAFSGMSLPHIDLGGIMSGLQGAFSGLSLPHIDLGGIMSGLQGAFSGLSLPSINLSGIMSGLQGAFSGLSLPHIDLGGIMSSLQGAFAGIQLPSMPDIGGMLSGAMDGMFSGIQLPKIPDIGGMLSGAMGGIFNGIQIPKLPDIAGMINSALSGIFAGISMPSIPLFASGVENYTGLAIVGEAGPELVSLNGGSVYPLTGGSPNTSISLPWMTGGGSGNSTQTISINIDGRALAVAMAPYIVSDLRLVLGAR